MSYFHRVQPVDNWVQMYYKYRPYIKARTKDLSSEDQDDIFNSLWFSVERAANLFDDTKGKKKSAYLFWWIKTELFRLIKKVRKQQNVETLIGDIEESEEAHFNLFTKAKGEDLINQECLKQRVKDLMSLLPDDYKFILKNYYGLEGCSSKSFNQIAKELNCSVNNCVLKHSRALNKLRARIRNNERYTNIGELLDYEA